MSKSTHVISELLKLGIKDKATLARIAACNVSIVEGVLQEKGIDEASIKADEFFAGLTPQQEYDQHIKKRKEALEKYGEIE